MSRKRSRSLTEIATLLLPLLYRNYYKHNYNLIQIHFTFLNRKSRRKRNSNTESPIAIISISPSLPRIKRRFSFFGTLKKIFTKPFVFIWKIVKDVGSSINSVACTVWYHTQNGDKIKALQGNKCKYLCVFLL